MKAAHRRPSLPAALLLVLVAAGCGKDSPTAPAAPTFPNVLGTYQSQQFMLTTLTLVSTGQSAQVACPGRLTISTQNGSQFSGSILRQTCPSPLGGPPTPPASGTVSGTVRLDGGTTFSVGGTGRPSLQDAVANLGCVLLTSSTAYNGAFSGSTLTVSATVNAQCGGQLGLIRIDQTISGTR